MRHGEEEWERNDGSVESRIGAEISELTAAEADADSGDLKPLIIS